MAQTTPNHAQTVSGWAAHNSSGKITYFLFKRRENGINDVTIKILYCGRKSGPPCPRRCHGFNGDITMYLGLLIPTSLPPVNYQSSHCSSFPTPPPHSDPLRSPIADPNRRTMAKKQPEPEQISSANAIFLGALAPGVNGPTWTTLRFAFVMLGVCLAVMLGLAFSSSDSWLVFHVAFLVLITATLFLLLSWFLAQTGLVSIEHQIREIGLVPNDPEESREGVVKNEDKSL